MNKFLAAALAAALFLTGCAGSNLINLKFAPVGANGATCTKTASVVRFSDPNTGKAIGMREGKVALYAANQEVAEWVAKAIKTQLEAIGCKAQYHDADGVFQTDYTIVGAITKCKVNQPSSTEVSVDLRFAVTVMKNGQNMFTHEYSSAVESKQFPSSNMVADAMQQCLQEIIQKQVLSDLAKVMG